MKLQRCTSSQMTVKSASPRPLTMLPLQLTSKPRVWSTPPDENSASQVMWLGSPEQLAELDVANVSVLSSTAGSSTRQSPVVLWPRHWCVSVYLHGTCDNYDQWSVIVGVCHKSRSPGIHHQWTVLPQLALLWHHRRIDALPPVNSECCHSLGNKHSAPRPHLAGSTTA